MPIGSLSNIPPEVKFIPWTAILKLPVPWPRCQDISHLHEKPVPGDNIAVISQAWAFQLHPDPEGRTVETICALLKKAAMILRTGGRMLVFCDYLCIPQAHAGHASLPAFEQQIVLKVMEYMPHLAFDADAVIHICNAEAVCHEAEPPLAPEDDYSVSIETLKNSCVLRQIGDIVQVQELYRENSPLHMFDQVVAINGHVITSMEDLPEEVRTGKPGACSSVCQTVFPSLASYFWHPTALMTRAPFGYRMTSPPGSLSTGGDFCQRPAGQGGHPAWRFASAPCHARRIGRSGFGTAKLYPRTGEEDLPPSLFRYRAHASPGIAPLSSSSNTSNRL